MIDYKLKKGRKIVFLIVYSLALIATLIDSWATTENTQYLYKYTFLVVGGILVSIIAMISDYKKNKFIIDKNYLVLHKPKGIHRVEVRIEWKDITRISIYGKFYFTKEISILTRYKCISMHITGYKEYKKMLRAIVENTKGNSNIVIDDKIFEIIDA